MTARVILIVAFLAVIATPIYMKILAIRFDRMEKKVKDLKAGKFDEAIHSHMNVEQRCQHCWNKDECPAYDTGVIYPCGYYMNEETGEKLDDTMIRIVKIDQEEENHEQ